MARNGLAAVRNEVRGYVDRGLLREVKEKQSRAAGHQWGFVWLTPRPFTLHYNPSPATLAFRDLLPKIGKAKRLAADVEAFIAQRCETNLPAHRRIDRERVDVRWIRRAGSLSLVVRIKRREYKYAVNKAFNLVNELFVLLRRSHSPYLEECFGISTE